MSPAAAKARLRALTRAGLVVLAVIALDQVTKHTLGTWIRPGQVRHVVPGLELVHERNSGVAFNLLQGSGAAVYAVTGLVVAGVATLLVLRPRRRLLWLPAGMLIGGAAGNLTDRATLGSVIDFIHLPHWPAFNFADVSITFGAVILALVLERGDGGDRA